MKLLWPLSGLLFVLPCARGQIPWATEAFSRKDKVDFYGIGEYLHQEDTDFSSPNFFNGATKLKLDDTGLGGFGTAFHINDFVSLHADFLLGPATFRAVFPDGSSAELGRDGYIQSGRFNVDYNIINRRLTPFLTAGIGYQYISYNEQYYNYYYYYHYYSETDFTWNVGAGIRWNVTDHFFIKASGGAQWLEYDNTDGITTQIGASFAIGATFP